LPIADCRLAILNLLRICTSFGSFDAFSRRVDTGQWAMFLLFTNWKLAIGNRKFATGNRQ
jgi:hypothetical protein